MNLLFPRPVRIHSKVATRVTQQRLNSVQPNASTVNVWRQLMPLSLVNSSGRKNIANLTHREMGGRPAQLPPVRALCMSPAPTPCGHRSSAALA